MKTLHAMSPHFLAQALRLAAVGMAAAALGACSILRPPATPEPAFYSLDGGAYGRVAVAALLAADFCNHICLVLIEIDFIVTLEIAFNFRQQRCLKIDNFFQAPFGFKPALAPMGCKPAQCCDCS